MSDRFGPVNKAPIEIYPKLALIWEHSVAATHDFLTTEYFEILKAQVPSYFPAMEHLYIYNDEKGDACGFVGVLDSKIEMLFVDPEYIGMGIGSALFDYAVQILGANLVDVNEQNNTGLAFYIRKGCKIISRSPLDPSGMPYPILHLSIAGS